MSLQQNKSKNTSLLSNPSNVLRDNESEGHLFVLKKEEIYDFDSSCSDGNLKLKVFDVRNPNTEFFFTRSLEALKNEKMFENKSLSQIRREITEALRDGKCHLKTNSLDEKFIEFEAEEFNISLKPNIERQQKRIKKNPKYILRDVVKKILTENKNNISKNLYEKIIMSFLDSKANDADFLFSLYKMLHKGVFCKTKENSLSGSSSNQPNTTDENSSQEKNHPGKQSEDLSFSQPSENIANIMNSENQENKSLTENNHNKNDLNKNDVEHEFDKNSTNSKKSKKSLFSLSAKNPLEDPEHSVEQNKLSESSPLPDAASVSQIIGANACESLHISSARALGELEPVNEKAENSKADKSRESEKSNMESLNEQLREDDKLAEPVKVNESVSQQELNETKSDNTSEFKEKSTNILRTESEFINGGRLLNLNKDEESEKSEESLRDHGIEIKEEAKSQENGQVNLSESSGLNSRSESDSAHQTAKKLFTVVTDEDAEIGDEYQLKVELEENNIIKVTPLYFGEEIDHFPNVSSVTSCENYAEEEYEEENEEEYDEEYEEEYDEEYEEAFEDEFGEDYVEDFDGEYEEEEEEEDEGEDVEVVITEEVDTEFPPRNKTQIPEERKEESDIEVVITEEDNKEFPPRENTQIPEERKEENHESMVIEITDNSQSQNVQSNVQSYNDEESYYVDPEELEERLEPLENHKEQLKNFITHNEDEEIKFELLFSKERDGEQSSTYHLFCDDIKNTVTIITTKTGEVFGYYTDIAINSKENCECDEGETFCFNLTKDKKYTWNYNHRKWMGHSEYFCCVGCGDILIENKFRNCMSNFPHTYNGPDAEKFELTGGVESFEVKGFECYEVTFLKKN